MTKSEAINRVSMVSTGTVRIRPEHVGPTRKNTYWWLATSRQWTPPRPINAYLIEHRDGLVLFDTGQDRASVTDPDYFPGGAAGIIYRRLARFHIGPEQTLTRRLAALGYDIRDVRTAVVSHLHQDHIGGLPELGHADILVSEREWRSMRRPLAAIRGYLRPHIDLPALRWRHIRPEPLGDPARFVVQADVARPVEQPRFGENHSGMRGCGLHEPQVPGIEGIQLRQAGRGEYGSGVLHGHRAAIVVVVNTGRPSRSGCLNSSAGPANAGAAAGPVGPAVSRATVGAVLVDHD